MKNQKLFNRWLRYALETSRMPLRNRRDLAALNARDDEGQRLWDACLADGWTMEEGYAALKEAQHANHR